MGGRAVEIAEGRVEGHDPPRRPRQVEGEPQRDRPAGGMPDDDVRAYVERVEELGDVGGHRVEAAAVMPEGPAEPLARQVYRHHPRLCGQRREEIAPTVRRGAGAMQHQQDGTAPRDLDVPADRSEDLEPAVLGVGPDPADRLPVHDRSNACATAAEIAAACARGSGR